MVAQTKTQEQLELAGLADEVEQSAEPERTVALKDEPLTLEVIAPSPYKPEPTKRQQEQGVLHQTPELIKADKPNLDLAESQREEWTNLASNESGGVESPRVEQVQMPTEESATPSTVAPTELPETAKTSSIDENALLEELMIPPAMAESPAVVRAAELLAMETELPDEAPQQAEALLAVMPTEFVTAVAESIETAEVGVQDLLIKMAEAGARLHELVTTDRVETDEAQQIEALLAVWYEELAELIGFELEEAEVARFIASVQAENYSAVTEARETDFEDVMHEFKPGILALVHPVAHVGRLMHVALGRMVVGLLIT